MSKFISVPVQILTLNAAFTTIAIYKYVYGGARMADMIRRSLTYSFIVFFCFAFIAEAQTPTIITNEQTLSRDQNLVINGSFEEPHLEEGDDFGGFLPGVDGDGYYFLSPINTVDTPIAQPDGWTISGGGTLSYGRWGNNINSVSNMGVTLPIAGQAWSSTEIHGERSIYLGNQTPLAISEEPTFMPNGEVVFTTPPIITLKPEYGPDPLQISQNVEGFVPGGVYRMSFWVSGEWSNNGFATSEFGTTAGDGIVGVLIEGYEILYLAIPAGNSKEPAGAPHVFGTDEFHTYTLEFVASDTEMEISFMNWGHFDSLSDTIGWERGQSTELIMDDIIINGIRNVPTLSQWSMVALAAILGIAAFIAYRRKQLTT